MNYRRRVVKRDKRNWIYALKPKGTKSGYSGSNYIIENGHQIFGLKVAPKTSTIIHSMELGKAYAFPLGRSLVRDDNDAEVKDLEKSEWQLVISCIEVLPWSERMLTFHWCPIAVSYTHLTLPTNREV